MLSLVRDSIQGLRPWAIYDWNEYHNVPNTWRNNRNTVLVFGRGNSDLHIRTMHTNGFNRTDFLERNNVKSMKVKGNIPFMEEKIHARFMKNYYTLANQHNHILINLERNTDRDNIHYKNGKPTRLNRGHRRARIKREEVN